MRLKGKLTVRDANNMRVDSLPSARVVQWLLNHRRLWLGALLVWVGFYQWVIAYTALSDLQQRQTRPAIPLNFGSKLRTISGLTSEAYEAGVREGDLLETVDGQPFDSMRVLFAAVNKRQPGGFLPAVVSSAKGTAFGVNIRLSGLADEPPTALEWIGQIAAVVGLPLLCLPLGFWVAFQYPNGRLAWLFLAIMIGFAGSAQEFPIAQLPGAFLLLVWWALFSSSFGLWAVWMILFAVLFPPPGRIDQRMAWLRCLWILPPGLLSAVVAIYEIGREFSFKAIESLAPLVQFVLKLRPDLLIPASGILLFLLLIAWKSVLSESLERMRRLRLLLVGSLLSFAPILWQSGRALKMHTDLLQWAGPAECFATLFPLALFPPTLTYVALIKRAMSVRGTLRFGVEYFLLKRGRSVLQSAIIALVIGATASVFARKNVSLTARSEVLVGGFLALLLFPPSAERLAGWIDRHFFQEAHEKDLALRELSLSLVTLMEESALIQTVAETISVLLQVRWVAFLLNDRGRIGTVYATGAALNPPLTLPESGGIARHLKVVQKAEVVYFDVAKNWIQTVHPAERAILRAARTEVVIPVALRQELLGILALGPRRDESPYTERELRLLNDVAKQVAFAIENSRLSESKAARPSNSRPEAKADDGEQPDAPELEPEISRRDDPGIRPNGFGQE